MSNHSERRRRGVRTIAPAFGLLAAGLLVWQGSYAAFSATTQDNSNVWSSASLSLQNNGGTGVYAATTTATFGGANIKPTATGTTCLTVKSIGTSGGNMAMYVSSLVDSAPSLGAQIKVTIDAGVPAADVQANCVGFPVAFTNVATNIALTALPVTYATGVPVAVATGTVLEAYRVTWTFVSQGTTLLDNPLQGKTVTAGFTWELQ
jgi:hypothetical protein